MLDAVKVMAQHDIGSLVVMDHGRMAGIVTFAEVLRALADRDGTLATLKISEIIERDPLTATGAMDVDELRRTMLERHARYVPVLDGDDAAGRRVVPRRGQGGSRGAELREPMLKSYIRLPTSAPEGSVVARSPAACRVTSACSTKIAGRFA